MKARPSLRISGRGKAAAAWRCHCTRPPPPQSQAGFTLVELLVSLLIFAFIGIAGFALLNGIVGSQARTEGRLERLGDLQRAAHIMTRDLEEADPATIAADPMRISFATWRRGRIGYELSGGELVRIAGGNRQTLLPEIEDMGLAFLVGGAWTPIIGDEPPRAARIVLQFEENAQPPAAGVMQRTVLLADQPPA